MAYGGFKNLTGRTASDNILRNKAFNFAKYVNYDGHHRGFASMVYMCFVKNAADGAAENENMSNKELAEELHKSIIKSFKIEKCTHRWYVHIVVSDMQLISKFNKGICFSL